MSEFTSNTRRCSACHEPMTLGRRDCQTCGGSSWEWIDPTMTDAEMKRRIIEKAEARRDR